MNRASKRQNKKSAASVQALIGIKVFTDYGLLTNSGELLFYLVTPTNLSVLSSSSIESKIRQLTLALSAIPELEIACTDSAECLDGNMGNGLLRLLDPKTTLYEAHLLDESMGSVHEDSGERQ